MTFLDPGELTNEEMYGNETMPAPLCRCTDEKRCLSCSVEDDDDSFADFMKEWGFEQEPEQKREAA